MFRKIWAYTATAIVKPIWYSRNSPFTVWFLSSVVIGLLTTAYADSQACQKDYDRLEEQFELASNEVWGRYWTLIDRMKNDQTVDPDAEAFLDTATIYAQFRGRTMLDVQSEALRAMAKLSKLASVSTLPDCPQGAINCESVRLIRTWKQMVNMQPSDDRTRSKVMVANAHMPTVQNPVAVEISPRCSVPHSLLRLVTLQ